MLSQLADHRRTEGLDMRHECGTLFELVGKAELYIISNIRRRFILTDERSREDEPEIPRKVIREALSNAFAHRVWSSSGYVQIDIYRDSVDIISPGWFIVGQDLEEHLEGESTSSDTRNRLISSTLFRSGDIESSGLGMRMIGDLCAEAGIKVAYERISFGTKLTLSHPDPFGGQSDKPTRESGGSAEHVPDGIAGRWRTDPIGVREAPSNGLSRELQASFLSNEFKNAIGKQVGIVPPAYMRS